MAKRLIKQVGEYQNLYHDDKTGIAWVTDGSTGCIHSCHSNIDNTGSVRGMKQLGFWHKDARTVRSNGFIYNIDTFICSDELDRIAADCCWCEACIERKSSKAL